MRLHPNRSDARDDFKRGYEQGQQDARAGKTRQLCDSPRGVRPPVTKADDSAFYHGYKAGAEESGDWKPAYRRYADKHELAPNGRLLSVVFPTGIGYADRKREKHGDYARCGFLSFDTLELTIEPDCPKSLAREIERDAARIQERRGEEYQVSASGQTVILGAGRPEHRSNGKYFVDLKMEAGHHRKNPRRRPRRRSSGSVSDVDERAVQQWMIDHLDDFYERGTGEPQLTELAEAAAAEFDLSREWYEPGSALWDWSYEAFEQAGAYERNAAPGTTARLDKIGDRLYGTAFSVRAPRGDGFIKLYFRIDGREGPYRVDVKDVASAPWEAIDDGHGYQTVKRAQECIRDYVARYGERRRF